MRSRSSLPAIKKLPDGNLGTLSVRMRGPDEREVLVMGMIHVARAEFYERVRAAMDHAPDTRIFAEGGTEPSYLEVDSFLSRFGLAVQKAKLNYPESRTTEEGIGPSEIIDKLLYEFGLTEPLAKLKANIRIRPEVVSDANQYTERLKQTVEQGTAEGVLSDDLRNAGSVMLRTLVANNSQNSLKTDSWMLKLPLIRTVYKVLIQDRNKNLVEAMSRTNPATKMIAPWGAAHLPDLIERLENEGWNTIPNSESYLPYVNEPSKMEILKAVWQVICSAF